jgi:two-component system sensor histidine kinase ChvG
MKFSIRTKLLILSFAVLSIPYVGLEYVREVERYLRESLELSLEDAAIAVAGPLHEQDLFFPVSRESLNSRVYVHKMPYAIQLDGYTDDWLSYISWSDSYIGEPANASDPLSFRFIISRHQQYYAALLQVRDGNIVYRNPGDPAATDNDHISLVFTAPSGELKTYYFSPADQGEFSPFEIVTRYDEFGFGEDEIVYITNVRAVWREMEDGYNLEMLLPVSTFTDRMGIVVNDVDDPRARKLVGTAGTAGPGTASNPGRILQSSAAIERVVESYARTNGRRIWVLDQRGQVLASAGDLEKDLPRIPLNLFYSLILPTVHQNFSDDLSGASRLQGEEINEALSGQAGSRWRNSPDGRAVIVSAAAPVRVAGEIRGAVVVEETTSNIQIQQRQAMASLFNKTLLVFVLVTLLLLFFATRLSIRIRRLEQEAAAAIDKHGRVVGNFHGSRSSDELGDLSRNYATMLDRLKHYNNYLENMAGRLSHELRTPIAVVQSSLDQFNDADTRQEKQTYLDRARDGIDRLNTIVIRLSEATRIEQALQASSKEATDITDLLGNCMDGYRIAYRDVTFLLKAPQKSLIQAVAPDLFVQMLDKLIRNAIDFKKGPEPIEVKLLIHRQSWEVQVINYGSELPDQMEHQLFNSMISVRDKKSGPEPHLGLGLYIVRLIVEFHGGTVSARNLEKGKGVIFTAQFPLE